MENGLTIFDKEIRSWEIKKCGRAKGGKPCDFIEQDETFKRWDWSEFPFNLINSGCLCKLVGQIIANDVSEAEARDLAPENCPKSINYI